MIVNGPFRPVRHPMYTAALGISFGLACLTQSLAILGVLFIYLALIVLLLPREEDGLRNAYGEEYALYQKRTRKLVPLVY